MFLVLELRVILITPAVRVFRGPFLHRMKTIHESRETHEAPPPVVIDLNVRAPRREMGLPRHTFVQCLGERDVVSIWIHNHQCFHLRAGASFRCVYTEFFNVRNYFFYVTYCQSAGPRACPLG